MRKITLYLASIRPGKKQTFTAGLLTVLFFISFSLPAFAQKGGGTRDIVVRACTQYIGNGMYRVNFGYDNPNKKEVALSEDNSYVIRGKDKSRSKGINNFKTGSVNKAFILEFNSKESVEWTIINPSGKQVTVTANANSSHCTGAEQGIIFPVYGQGNGKTSEIIGLELNALAEGNAGDTPSDIIYQINSDKVLIEVIPQAGKLQPVIDLLRNTFGLKYDPDPLLSDFIIDPQNISSAIDVFFPVSRLKELSTYTDLINFVRPLYKPIQNSGITTSQGDDAQKSNVVRESFSFFEEEKLDGRGVKIGVISNSYNTQPFTTKSQATIDVENGDLPGADNPDFPLPVDVIKDYPYGVASDEGRAMLQIIHDVAPGAELAFNTGILSPRDFENAINNLKAADCDIIVDDITFVGEPFFRDSRISNAIRQFTAASAMNSYFTSAGNFANNGYQSNFNASSNIPVTNFIPAGSPARAHVFDGGTDVFQKIKVVPGVYMIALQWDEPVASQENDKGAVNDLDIYLVDDAGNLLVGNNRFNVAGDPTEFIVFQSSGTGEANILITSANGAPSSTLAFRYIAFRANGLEIAEYGGAPTVSGHAMTPEAVTVGAVDYRKSATGEVQTFSSYAGALPNSRILEIDFTAPDGGNTNVASIGQDIAADEDSFPNFFGTSASAPHAAGAIALMLSAVADWYPEGLPSGIVEAGPLAGQVLSLFKSTALASGEPQRSGAGLINSEDAHKRIAAQTAVLTGLTVEEGKNVSAENFVVTITGKYFPDDPKVIFDNKELEVLESSSTQITALVDKFAGNPGLLVYTTPVTPGGTDGGNSNLLYFFEGDKRALNIIADEINVEFGQAVNFSYTVEGLPEDTTLESLGLPEIVFTSPAVLPYPDVNNYNIVPSFKEALTEEQLALYQVNFINGLLAVSKKELSVKPEDAAFTYGQPVLYNTKFTYDPTGIENNDHFLSLLQQQYTSTFYPENTWALVNDFRAVVNEVDILALLNSGSWIVSERSIQNLFRAVVNDMNVIDLNMQHFTDYAEAISDGTTNDFRAVVNDFRAVVNGEDLFNGSVQLSYENTFRAVVNDSGLGGESDGNTYQSVFAIIDLDPNTDTGEVTIPKFYSLGLITGLDATYSVQDRHYIYPGAYLAPIAANFNITYDSGRLTINPATLHVETEDIVIYKGETITLEDSFFKISGFVYNETPGTVFPNGVPYYFVDSDGNDYKDGDTGVFYIRIREPQNYTILYDKEGKLYVNPVDDLRKVRVYLDCVEEISGDPDGFTYQANFRYENPNAETIYVLPGTENQFTGEANYRGEPPFIFLPGQGKFSIPFDGYSLRWELTTYDSTHKTAVSTESSADSARCGSATVKESFVLFPNPVSTVLNIEHKVSQSIGVDVFDFYGRLKFSKLYPDPSQKPAINMSSYYTGFYIVRITTPDNVHSYTIIKE